MRQQQERVEGRLKLNTTKPANFPILLYLPHDANAANPLDGTTGARTRITGF